MKKKIFCSLILIIFSSAPIFSNEGEHEETIARANLRLPMPSGHVINFEKVSITEFIRFVSKIAGANFIYDENLLDFNITLVSGKPTSSEHVLSALIKILEQHNLTVKEQDNYFLIKKLEKDVIENLQQPSQAIPKNIEPALLASTSFPPLEFSKDKEAFFVYKLKYHQGGEIQQAIKQVATDPSGRISVKLSRAIGSMQWIKATNSLLYSGDEEAIQELTDLVKSLDTPLKQVFIDVLVIETDVKNSLDFGLEWTGSGKLLDRVGMGFGNFPPGPGKAPLASKIQQIGVDEFPQGAKDFNIGRGFDLGVIGDIIWHKGKSFLSLGSLISALQIDGNSTIVLNQKLITQDNKGSSIFVGDNIPFTGSIVQTVGASQQTTSNIEYRDVGVSLNITPLLGEGNVITLDISEEISEATMTPLASASSATGIQTTKTNMITRAHVPDQHFLVLSGMVRNTKKKVKSGIPCLGGLPLVGAIFSKNQIENEKRNIIIFVKPQIINSVEQYQQITAQQEQLYKSQAPDKEVFEKNLHLIDPIINPGEESHGNSRN